MAQLKSEDIKKYAEQILDEFEDGFTWTDVIKLVPMVMEIVERLSSMTGAEKKAAAVDIINYVIDETDLPWIPDDLVDPLLKKAVPVLIELVIDSTKGKLTINQK